MKSRMQKEHHLKNIKKEQKDVHKKTSKQDAEKLLWANDLFYCEHISDSKDCKSIISDFSIEKPTGLGLVNYLKNQSLQDEKDNMMKTYLVRDILSDELVGYFSIKAGSVSTNEKRLLWASSFDSLPGVEIANLAVNDHYRQKRPQIKNIAFIILYDFIIPIINMTSTYVGINIIYIFALPYIRLINHYQTMGFNRLNKRSERIIHRRIKPRYDEGCIFMYMKL